MLVYNVCICAGMGGVLIGFGLLLFPVNMFHKLIKIKSNQHRFSTSYLLLQNSSSLFSPQQLNFKVSEMGNTLRPSSLICCMFV